MLPTPFEVAVLILSTREIKSEPGVDFVLVADYFCSILRVHFYHFATLCPIRSSFVIQDNVKVETHVVLIGDVAKSDQVLLWTPFCSSCTFLVELAEVIEVVL